MYICIKKQLYYLSHKTKQICDPQNRLAVWEADHTSRKKICENQSDFAGITLIVTCGRL